MKTIKLFLISSVLFALQSCYKTGDIQVQNNIGQVKIEDVKWGEIQLASGLLPGQTSAKKTVAKHQQKLPSAQRVTFTMTANNKLVYLQTEEEYLLDQDGYLLIVLTDDTKVRNPNE